MQVFFSGEVEKPFGVADYGIAEKTAVRKDGEGVAKRRWILNDTRRRVIGFGGETVEKMDGVARIRQRWQQSLDCRNLDLYREIQHCFYGMPSGEICATPDKYCAFRNWNFSNNKSSLKQFDRDHMIDACRRVSRALQALRQKNLWLAEDESRTILFTRSTMR